MKKSLLLKRQRNDVLAILEKTGLEPAGFRWEEVSVVGLVTVVEAGIVSSFVHESTQYQFMFDMRLAARGTIWLEFSPGRDVPEETHDVKAWPQVLQAVKVWAACLKSELDTPDLWAELAAERDAIEALTDEPGQEPIASVEKTQLVDLVEATRADLLKRFGKDSQQGVLILRKLTYLQESIDRQSRADWIHTAIGVFFTIAVGLALAGSEARELLARLYGSLRQVFRLEG